MTAAVQSRRPAGPTPASQSARATSPTSTASPTPSRPEDIRDGAIQDVHTLRANPRRRAAPTWRRAAATVARLQNEEGSTSVRMFLARNPDIGRALAVAPRETVEAHMEALGCEHPSNAMDNVETVVRSQIRSGIRASAQRAIMDRIGSLHRLRADVLENPSRYADAPEGTPEASIGAALGLRAGSRPEKAADLIDASVAGLLDLHERFTGMTWREGDFPQTFNQVSRELGMRVRTGEDTILDEIAADRTGDLTNADSVAPLVTDTAHMGLEAAHIIGHGLSLATSAALGVALVGLGVGMAIHHAVEERREQFHQDAAALGIR